MKCGYLSLMLLVVNDGRDCMNFANQSTTVYLCIKLIASYCYCITTNHARFVLYFLHLISSSVPKLCILIFVKFVIYMMNLRSLVSLVSFHSFFYFVLAKRRISKIIYVFCRH